MTGTVVAEVALKKEEQSIIADVGWMEVQTRSDGTAPSSAVFVEKKCKKVIFQSMKSWFLDTLACSPRLFLAVGMRGVNKYRLKSVDRKKTMQRRKSKQTKEFGLHESHLRQFFAQKDRLSRIRVF
jgi:hypothetical protein